MKCPFTFANPACDVDEECRDDCALSMNAVFYDVKENRIVNSAVCALSAMACNMDSVRFVPQCDDCNIENARDWLRQEAAGIALENIMLRMSQSIGQE